MHRLSTRASGNSRMPSGVPGFDELVDLLLVPERGLRDGVLFTHTLVRIEPAPERRLLGNLGNLGALLGLLGIEEITP